MPAANRPDSCAQTPQVAQAAAAVQSAWEAGVTRQRVELLLPLIGATDLDDCEQRAGGIGNLSHVLGELAAVEQPAPKIAAPGPARRSTERARQPCACSPIAGPGGIRQQFKAALPLVEQLLRSLKQLEGLKGPLKAEIWDDGDAVGAWCGESGLVGAARARRVDWVEVCGATCVRGLARLGRCIAAQ
jgi:hypothetical protein